MLRLLRPALSSLSRLFQFSFLSLVPSYGKVFGENPIAGQIVLSIAAILTIRSCIQFYSWRQEESDNLDEQAALSKLKSDSFESLRGVLIAFLLVSFLLLFMAVDTLQSMATIRAALLLGIVFLTFCVTIGTDTSQSPCIVMHIGWGLQMILLPGMWTLANEAVFINVAYIYVGCYGLIIRFVVALMLSAEESSVKKQSTSQETEKKDAEGQVAQVPEVTTAEEDAAAPKPNKSEEKVHSAASSLAKVRRERSRGMLVMVVDVILLVLFQFG
jgi:hypothetical protein